MARQKDEFALWAEKHVKGIDESAVFMQIYNPRVTLAEDPGYILQIGYAVMCDKPIAILAGYGDQIPKKLEKVADVIEYFDRGSMRSIEKAARNAITKARRLDD